MQPDEQNAFANLIQGSPQPPTPPQDPVWNPPTPQAPQTPQQPQQPDPNAAPAWADQLLQTVSGLQTEFNSFKEQYNQPPEPEQPPAPGAYTPPRTWEELEERQRQAAREEAERIQTEKDQEAASEALAERQATDEIEANLDMQLAQLEQSGVLPKVQNPTDANDTGKRARQELFGYALKMKTTDLFAVSDTLREMHQAGKRFDAKENKFIRVTAPGADAPIAGGTPPTSSTNSTMPGPDFFRRHNLDEIAEIAQRAI